MALILHPLSYLIKKTNYNAAKIFFSHYRILESVIFSSQEFADTSRISHFPIVMTLYEYDPWLGGRTYDRIRKYRFKTLEGDSFSLDQWEYASDFINKYPTGRRYNPEILFYTLRDINALKRSRTFIPERCANAVDIPPEKLPYYCYIDLFKRFASPPYWMGNFDIPLNHSLVLAMKDDIVEVSQFYHPEVFGERPAPSEEKIKKVAALIQKILQKI